MNTAKFAFVVLAAGELAIGAREASAQDARWTPWLGCWEMVRETVHEGDAVAGDAQPSSPPSAPVRRAAPRVCVTREGLDAVKLTTTVEGQPPLEQTIVADGSRRPIEDKSCRGSQRAEWSRRGARLYSQADVTCGEEARNISGLSLVEPGGAWLDVRTVRIGSHETTRVSRYRRVAGEATTAAAESRFTLDDVKEGISKVSPRVVEAALVETKASFGLSSRQLIELADAHVPPEVIDLIVALSYPRRFVVERTIRHDANVFASNDPFFFAPSAWLAGFGLYDDFGFPALYYSPLAYSYLGRFEPGFLFFGDGLLVGGGGGGAPASRPTGTGRVINGVGYTQVRPRNAQETSDGSTESSSTRGSTRSSFSGDSGGSAGGGGGTVSSGGFSSGGAADSGRTAVPR